MSDVVEGGPSRPGPPRRVWLAACVVALAAVSLWAVVGTHSRGPGTDRPPAADLASAVTRSPAPPSSSPWPSAAGACGTTVSRPLVSAQPLTERIGIRLLVGGYGVRLVDADTATARHVRGIPTDPAHTVSDLVSAAGVVYVVSAPCEGDARRIYRLDHDTARLVADTPVGGLLAGADHVWTVHYPAASAPATARVILRPLGGGRALALPSEAYPVADIDAGIVVVASHLSASPHVVLVDPTTGRPVRTLGVGWPLAVDRGHLLLMGSRCDVGQATPSCTIVRVDVRTGRRDARYSLPAGRVPLSAGALSRDGRLAVFQLTRTHADPRFNPGHPIPPADIAVLHLDTGRLDLVPGLELAPKTGVGLTVADDSSWIFAAVNDGDHTDLLAWHPGLSQPRSLARLAGPINWTPSLLIA